MKVPLYLSRETNSEEITVSAEIVEHLRPYQIDGIRFLYQQYFFKKQNVVLNNDSDMNNPRQISAFLTAVTRPFPTLIICRNISLPKWHYEFSKSNLRILTPKELIQDESSNDDIDLPDAVILSHDQAKHLKTLPINDWFFVIIDDIDLLMNSRFIKNISTQFRIALTYLNFVILDNPELKWKIIKWTNPNLVEEKDLFIKMEQIIKQKLLNPYPDYWRRITWIIEGENKPTDLDMNNYDIIINDWCKRKNLIIPKEKQTRKRKSNQKPTKNGNSKRRLKNESTFTKFVSSSSENSDSEASLFGENEIYENTNNSDTEDDDILNSLLFVQQKINKNNFSNVKFTESTNIIKDTKNILTSDDDIETTKAIDFKYNNYNKFNNLSNSDDENSLDKTINAIFDFNSQPKNIIKNHQKEDSDDEQNFILDSLIGDTKTNFKINEPEFFSDNSCPILDSLL